jgi:hypothetical protein
MSPAIKWKDKPGGEVKTTTFIVQPTITVYFNKIPTDEMLCALGMMPGHLRTQLKGGKAIATFRAGVYADDQFEDAIKEVLDKSMGR